AKGESAAPAQPSEFCVVRAERSRLLFVRHVDDLNAAVIGAERMIRVLEPGLAVADGHQSTGIDTMLLHEEALDCIRAPLRELLVVGLASFRIRVPGKDEYPVLQLRFRERVAESGGGGQRLRVDLGGVVVEGD